MNQCKVVKTATCDSIKLLDIARLIFRSSKCSSKNRQKMSNKTQDLDVSVLGMQIVVEHTSTNTLYFQINISSR